MMLGIHRFSFLKVSRQTSVSSLPRIQEFITRSLGITRGRENFSQLYIPVMLGQKGA